MTDIVAECIPWYNSHSREDTPYRNRIRSNSQLNSNMNTSPILTFLHNDTESNEAFNLAVRLTLLWYKNLCKPERHYLVKWWKAFITVKHWPNGLAEVDAGFRLEFDLRFVWPPTCVDFGRAQIRTQVDTSFSPFDHPTQVDTSWSQVNCIFVKFTAFCELRELPFGHPSQVRTQVLVL